jgi:hypothetical protein
MAVDDRALLRDLRAAIEESEGAGAEARQEAIRAVMQRHGATLDDVARLLHRARSQHQSQLRGLASRLEGLIARREEDASTVHAVEEFLRGQRP